MKNRGLVVSLVIAGILLIVAFIISISRNDFKLSPSETLLLNGKADYFLGQAAIDSIPAKQAIVFYIGKEKHPGFASSLETKTIEIDKLLSADNRKILTDKNLKKILVADKLTDAIKVHTFFTRIGYKEIFVYEPDYGKPGSQGNEKAKFEFKPEKQIN